MVTLLAVKLAVTMLAVVGLSLVAERMSPRLAGVLAGFPHGIAIVLYFIGVEQGVEFATRAAGFATAGLGANVVLAYAYARAAGLAGRGPVAVGLAALAGLAAFLSVALVVKLIAPGPVLAVATTLLAIGLVRLALDAWPPATVGRKPRAGLGELVIRALLAGAIVVNITGLAAVIGPGWAGLFSGFPVVTFPLLLILHLRHGPAQVAAVVRHYPFGVLALVVFTLTVRWAYPGLGIGLGTLAGLGAALVWLAGASWASNRG